MPPGGQMKADSNIRIISQASALQTSFLIYHSLSRPLTVFAMR